MRTESLVFNGINAATGSYLLPEMTAEEIANIAREEKWDKDYLSELRLYHQYLTEPFYGIKEVIDPKNLAETGWGVIFASDANPAIREALSPLLQHRKAQAGERYREFSGSEGYRYDVSKKYFESKLDFLFRHETIPPSISPEKIPYYLLIVGDPQTIPYHFQSRLGLGYAVGRIHFDRPEDYAFYAHSVAASEQKAFTLPRQVAFFGVQNPDDAVTSSSTEYFVKPLAEEVGKDLPNWDVQTFFKEQTTKAQLALRLGGEQTPALLLASGHGIGFLDGDPRRLAHQGALLCQDWPGPVNWRKPIPEEFYFAADDVQEQTHLLGTIILLFASYSAGTPGIEDLPARLASKASMQKTDSFSGNLLKRLLSHPKGGALAVVGQPGHAWGEGLRDEQRTSRVAVFRKSIKRLLKGEPVGLALTDISLQYAGLTIRISEILEDAKFGIRLDIFKLAELWIGMKDMGSYSIFGDPAVRLSGANRME